MLVQHLRRSVVGCRNRILDVRAVAWASRLHQLGRHLQNWGVEELDQQQPNQSWNSACIGIVAAEVVAGILLAAEAEAGSYAEADAGSFAEAEAGNFVEADAEAGHAAALLHSRSTVVVAGAVDEVAELPALGFSMDEASGTKVINLR